MGGAFSLTVEGQVEEDGERVEGGRMKGGRREGGWIEDGEREEGEREDGGREGGWREREREREREKERMERGQSWQVSAEVFVPVYSVCGVGEERIAGGWED